MSDHDSEVPATSDSEAPAKLPPKNKKIKHTKTELREAIERSNGTMASVIRELGHNKMIQAKAMGWIEEYPDLLEMFRARQQELTDMAEDVLIKNLMTPGKRQLKTAMFILSRVPNERFNPSQTEAGMAQTMQHFMALVQHALTPDQPITVSHTPIPVVDGELQDDMGDEDDDDDDGDDD